MRKKEIVRYGMVGAEEMNKLVDDLNTMIKSGWQPYGNPLISVVKDVWVINQAIVMYSEKTDNDTAENNENSKVDIAMRNIIVDAYNTKDEKQRYEAWNELFKLVKQAKISRKGWE